MACRKTLPRCSGPLLAVLLTLILSGCTVELYSGLSEQEANDMLAALASEGIDARKQRGDGAQWTLEVERSRLSQAVAALRNNGLPQERFTSLGDAFQRQGLVSTPAEERMRYIHAVSQELAQTIRTLDGVVAARVHVVVPASDPLSDKTKPSSAAVFIKHRPDVDLRLLVPAVKDLVAHSIEGLSHDQVSLTLVSARRLTVPESGTAARAPIEGPTTAAGSDRTESTASAWLAGDQRLLFMLAALLLAAAVALAVLPGLLRKRGRDWSWLWRQVLRR